MDEAPALTAEPFGQASEAEAADLFASREAASQAASSAVTAYAATGDVVDAAGHLHHISVDETPAAASAPPAVVQDAVMPDEIVEEQPQTSAPLPAPTEPVQSHEARKAEAPSPLPPPLKLEWPSDLVQIETDPHKARAVAVFEEPQAPRQPRTRRAPPPVSNEPLVQVETRSHAAGAESPQP